MKHFFLFLSLAACLSPAMAQRQWQLRLGGGYDFSTVSQRVSDQMTGPSAGISAKSISSSLGRGLVFNTDITCWLNRYFGITAGAAWHKTLSPVKGKSAHYLSGLGNEEKNTWRSNLLLATAGIALKIPDTKLNPYARIGLVLPLYSRVTSDDDWIRYPVISPLILPGSRSGTSHKVYQLRNTPGYSAAAGIAPALSKHTAVFAEINLQSLAILARHSTVTSNKENGVEKISTLDVYSRETDYVKEATNHYPYSLNAPNQQATFSFPYSSIGIHIGVSFKL